MIVGSLNHVVLTVNDLAKSRAFYERLLPALGYRLLYEQAGSFAYRGADGLKLYFTQAPPENVGATFDRYRVGLNHLAFNAPDRAFVDDVQKKLESWGVKVLDHAAEYPQYEPGYYAVFFLDPDGMKIEVVHV
ncbi:MAG: VOC family protein [Deltaproteobacteria bacterium]|nr:VOC family protein [Deltaproteobacteria bacterium]